MSASSRRHDLDALRVGAFLLLILYHLGMFYVPWDWHVKSEHITPALEIPMGLLNPWRLTLLFVISGAATRYMMEKLDARELAGRRSLRLLAPLLFGMLVVVAPQAWAEVVEKRGYTGSFLAFWPRYLTFDQSFGLILPTYNHLWFVVYLWVYTMLLAIAAPLLPALDRWAGRLLQGPGLFLLPIAAFGLYLATAGRVWGLTHIVWADAYGHLQFGTAFLLGALLARRDEAWDRLSRARTWTLGVALVLGALKLWLARVELETSPAWHGAGLAVLREAYAWTAICALFGYARHYIRRGSPLLATLNEAVFPFYIVHQTAIVLTGHALKPLPLSAPAEAAMILMVTVTTCLAAYWLARMTPALRLPLGLKPLPRPAAALSPAE